MPLMIIGVHFAIFGGVVWLRFYDIEVRAARSGEIAGRMAETERLAAVGEVAASVAHEVRNPLAGIRSLAQRLAEEAVDPDRSRRYAGVIVEETSRLDRIVGDLLALARRRADEVEADAATPLTTLFDDLTLLVASRAEQAGVRLVMRANDLTAPAPRAPLGQALLNLILNAIQHSPGGGTVSVEAEAGITRAEIVIAVRDEGPGVPAEERERIFKPFHSAGTDGTGLGLSVVRHLARELGWNIEVRDAHGGGAEFRLTISAASRSASRPPSRVGEML
jgi:signal transduction histidine kinase